MVQNGSGDPVGGPTRARMWTGTSGWGTVVGLSRKLLCLDERSEGLTLGGRRRTTGLRF